jgi:hypothetical protein
MDLLHQIRAWRRRERIRHIDGTPEAKEVMAKSFTRLGGIRSVNDVWAEICARKDVAKNSPLDCEP